MWPIELRLGSGPALSSPARQFTLFRLSQLQKAAEPWVLKHSDMEKQDNSWKEVRASLLPRPIGPDCTRKFLACEKCDRGMLTLSQKPPPPYTLGSRAPESLPHDCCPCMWTWEGFSAVGETPGQFSYTSTESRPSK